jgi:type 1 glutamine amidotransferase
MRCLSLACLFLASTAAVAHAADPPKARKVVLIAGPLDAGHPAGTHEYEKTVRAFKHCLDNASNVKGLRVEAHLKGWPEKASTLDDADTIVIVASGSDRKEADHPLLVGDRLAVIEKQMKRGCGLCLIHWATFVPKAKAGDKVLEWVGGYFDYESGPAKNGWYSKIQTVTVKATPGRHPITTGMTPFEVKDEFYYNIRFRERDPRLVPILTVPMAKEGEQTVAWAVERPDGGRGFGFTGGHFFDNWRNDDFRKMALNAILWTTHAEVPDGGVKSEFPGDREIGLVTVGNPSQVLILTGHDGPFHNWRETSQVLKHVIERDGRLRCRIVDNPNDFLAREDLSGYDLIVQNYVNWERPGLPDAAKANLLKYLESGRGLAVIHFANGAFHPSLPNAKEGDWPEYRKIVRRVWDHGKGLSGHDAYGPFRVEIAGKHPITDGLSAFDTVDELYYRQQGDMTLEPLVTAKSKDTGKAEPLAWAYSYGKARVFQTVLGHSAESIRGDGPATLIRRGAAWAAGRDLKPEKPAAKPVEKRLTFAEGKFGKALDARVMPASIEQDERYRKPPLTVECWAKLFSKTGFNVLVSTDPKSSAQHWEIYTYAGSGVFSAYLPGTLQGEIKSAVDVCDGKWHHLAMTHDGKTVGLYVDGKKVKEQTVAYRPEAKPEPGPLVFGGAYVADQRIGCDGLIDDVRISNIVRPIAAAPASALTRDGSTVSLWNLDGDEGISADTNWTPPTPVVAGEAWEKETDKDWVDGRFSKTDTGPYLNATIDYEGPKGKVRAYKGTAIKVGDRDKGEATVLFDRNTLRLAAAWTGGFLNHSSRRFGLLNTPTPNGKMLFGTSALAGWADDKGSFDSPHSPTGPLPKEWAKFKGVYLMSGQTVLAYSIHGTDVLERHAFYQAENAATIGRTLIVGPSEKERRCLIADFPPDTEFIEGTGGLIAKGSDGKSILTNRGVGLTAKRRDGKSVSIALRGTGSLSVDDRTRVTLVLPAGKAARRAHVSIGTGSLEATESAGTVLDLADEIGQLMDQMTPGKAPATLRWTKPVTTTVEPGKDTGGPLVVDTLPLPYENPWNALFYVAGVDFLPDGRIAICTAHGDVWTAKESSGTITWHRFATGLYQPLGLKVVDGKVVIVERGQLTRLHDTNNDGEADFYENLNNDWHAGGGEHSYDTCLETDPAGNFYFFKTGDDHTPTGGCLLKVSKDGSKMEVYATGFRHPIGLGVSPTGQVSGADQEGNWMPVTRLDLYKQGGFYGDMRTHHRPTPPKTYDDPLIWLPKEADNSAGGQVWVPKGQWGALGGHMLHLSYGRCRAYAVLPDGDKFAAGAVDLGVRFLSGSARGRFGPDEHLYVVGLDGWQTAAQKDGSLQRVRHTGKSFETPVAFRTTPTTVTLTFDQPLDPKSAADLSQFAVTRCNYIWSANYGSKNWSVSDPKKEGLDTVPVTAAALSPDGKALTLTVEVRPAMHTKVAYTVRTASGKELKGAVYTTVR